MPKKPLNLQTTSSLRTISQINSFADLKAHISIQQLTCLHQTKQLHLSSVRTSRDFCMRVDNIYIYNLAYVRSAIFDSHTYILFERKTLLRNDHKTTQTKPPQSVVRLYCLLAANTYMHGGVWMIFLTFVYVAHLHRRVNMLDICW